MRSPRPEAQAPQIAGYPGVRNDVARGTYECARVGVARIFVGDVARRSGWRRRRRYADVESYFCDESLERVRTFGGTVPHAA
jgi:hypothetical protein